MSTLSEHVQLTIVATSGGIARAGFGVPMILSYTAGWTERTRTYGSVQDVAGDFATTSYEYRAANAIFAQSPHPQQLVIGRGANKPTQVYVLTVAAAAASQQYFVNVDGVGVTPTQVVVTTPSTDLVGTLLPRTTDVLTYTAHGMSTGDGPYRVSNAGGALPTGLAADTNYWIIRVTADTFSFASSKSNALALTAVALSGDGSGTQTILRTENDVIMAQLLQGLNAVAGKNYTAVQSGASGSQLLTITASAAASWFSLEVSNPALLHIKQTHVDPGIQADLDAILTENDSWYALWTTFNSIGLVEQAASWTEGESKIYLFDVNETDAVTTVVGNGDTLDALNTLTYNRTAGAYHPSPANFMSAAWLGRVLPDDPGSETWKFKTLAGVAPVALTATQRVNLRARHANTYQTVAGRNITWEGTVAGGTFGFIDVTRGLDWIEDDMTKGVFGALVASEKIPYTNAGIAIIRSEVKSTLVRALSMGIISGDDVPPFVITVPLVSAVSDASKALRQLPGVQFSATLAGAIHDVIIDGTVST